MNLTHFVLSSITESSVGTGAGCFPEGAMVYTEKGPRDIATIQRGDKVLSASDDGKMIYSEVSGLICSRIIHAKLCCLYLLIS